MGSSALVPLPSAAAQTAASAPTPPEATPPPSEAVGAHAPAAKRRVRKRAVKLSRADPLPRKLDLEPHRSKIGHRKDTRTIDRKVIQQLQQSGILSDLLDNSIVAQSRTGPLGRITVRRWDGPQGRAAKLVRDFDKVLGKDRSEIAAQLTASPTCPETCKRLAAAILDRENAKKSISLIIAELGVDPSLYIRHRSAGLVELKKWESVALAGANAPHQIRELIRASLPKQGLCRTCIGTGKVHKRPDQSSAETRNEDCRTCGATGWVGELDKESQWAMDRLLEIQQFIGRGAAMNIQQNQINVQPPAGRLMEQVLGRVHGTGPVIDVEPMEKT